RRRAPLTSPLGERSAAQQTGEGAFAYTSKRPVDRNALHGFGFGLRSLARRAVGLGLGGVAGGAGDVREEVLGDGPGRGEDAEVFGHLGGQRLVAATKCVDAGGGLGLQTRRGALDGAG